VSPGSAAAAPAALKCGITIELVVPNHVIKGVVVVNLVEQRFVSQPVSRVIEEINPILRGWVTYFAIGHSTRCFSYIKQWVEKKIRRHLMRARGRKGFGWKRWSTKWLYDKLGIFNGYWVSWQRA